MALSTCFSFPFSITKRSRESSSISKLCQRSQPPVSTTNRTRSLAVAAHISFRSPVAIPPNSSLDSRSDPHKYTKIVQVSFSPIGCGSAIFGRSICILPEDSSTWIDSPAFAFRIPPLSPPSSPLHAQRHPSTRRMRRVKVRSLDVIVRDAFASMRIVYHIPDREENLATHGLFFIGYRTAIIDSARTL